MVPELPVIPAKMTPATIIFKALTRINYSRTWTLYGSHRSGATPNSSLSAPPPRTGL